MKDVFEPMANFGGEVFEPMNFDGDYFNFGLTEKNDYNTPLFKPKPQKVKYIHKNIAIKNSFIGEENNDSVNKEKVMKDVFEPTVNFGGEVFEPMNFDGDYSNFGWFKTVGNNIKAGVKDFVKNPIKAVGHLAKDTGRNVAKVGVKVAQVVMKVNPLFLTGRGGFLFIMARNGFGLADRLAPLYLEDGDPILRKYKPEAVKQVRDKRYNIENAWKNMGGEINPFKKAILEGRGRPPRILKKGDKSFDGSQYPYSVTFDGNYEYFGSEPNYDMFDGEVYTYFDGEQYVSEHKSNFFEPLTIASQIISGLGVVATFIGLLKSNKVPEQPFVDGTPESKAQDTMPTSASDIDPNAPILSPDGTKVIDPKTGVEISKQTNPDGSPKDTDGKSKDAKFLGMPRKVGIGVTIGVSVLAVAGIIFAVVKSRK